MLFFWPQDRSRNYPAERIQAYEIPPLYLVRFIRFITRYYRGDCTEFEIEIVNNYINTIY
ncbi:hypothetical protein CE91St59_03440 [[Clostridium] scindens]|nr:hypothetical protein CE91St59_03440 [[Clostridium] scindens]BDF18767.1 hypothetical protein CE91St60_03500 [[Clostridium] scindens]